MEVGKGGLLKKYEINTESHCARTLARVIMTNDYKKVGNRMIKRKSNWNGEINTNKRITSVAWFGEIFFSDVTKITSEISWGFWWFYCL